MNYKATKVLRPIRKAAARVKRREARRLKKLTKKISKIK